MSQNPPLCTPDNLFIRRWQHTRARKQECDQEIYHLQGLLDKDPNDPHRQIYLDELEHEKHIRQIICRLIPDE